MTDEKWKIRDMLIFTFLLYALRIHHTLKCKALLLAPHKIGAFRGPSIPVCDIRGATYISDAVIDKYISSCRVC